MGLNVSKGNMYEFISHTFNIIKGACPHNCKYCYMKRFGKQRPVRLDEKEFRTDLGSGNFIFVGSSCDMFADEIPVEWIIRTLEHCSKFDNRYLFQSKNPNGMVGFLSGGSIACTTIETNRWMPRVMRNSPTPDARVDGMQILHATGIETFVTIEPIMDFDIDEMVKLIWSCRPKQVNIGADSCGHKLLEPSYDKVMVLVGELEQFTKIHQKRNLNRLFRGKP